MLYVKNWKKFQHFKDRRPPWIKLYRDILDDIEWHKLDGELAKTLIMMWLLASESPDGALPSIEEMSFRLRTDEKSIKTIISKLDKWIYQDDISEISQDDIKLIPKVSSREETETEKNTFIFFWSSYPRKADKKKAEKAFNNLSKAQQQLALADIKTRFIGIDRRFIPLPTTYLHGERWNDEKEAAPISDLRGAV